MTWPQGGVMLMQQVIKAHAAGDCLTVIQSLGFLVKSSF